MNKESQLMEEYKMLRSELLYFMNKDTTLITCLFSGVTAVLFFALKENLPECCVLSYLIILPICSKLAYHQKQMAKISSYMVLFLENNLEIQWETRLKEKQKGGISRKKHLLKFSECPMMATATFMVYGYLIWTEWETLEKDVPFWFVLGVMIFLFLMTLYISEKIYKVKELRIEYQQYWTNN